MPRARKEPPTCHPDRPYKAKGLCQQCYDRTRFSRPNSPKYKTKYRDYHFQTRYGISSVDYEQLLERQQDVCAICHQTCATGRALAVDHDHETGEVRGLLCFKCNSGIGFLQDSPLYLQSALNYLTKDKVHG